MHDDKKGPGPFNLLQMKFTCDTPSISETKSIFSNKRKQI